MVPSSVEKMNILPPNSPFENCGLTMIPVGAALPVLPGGRGIVITSGTILPVAPYKVDSPELLSDIQTAVPGANAIPQALIRFLSVVPATPCTLEVRFFWV